MDTEIRVLIADDEQIARETMRDYLPWAEMGMQTPICVENGALALDHLCHDKIDIFIMDIRMPIMDGMALLEEITRRNIDVLIIVLSAYDQFEYAQKAISSRKVFEYVLKPIRRGNFCTLLQKAAAAVRSKRAESSPDSQALYDKVRKNYNGFLMQGHTAEGIALVRQKLEASKASAVIEHCLRAIDSHYMERTFSLNWLAEEMKLNPNYLSTRFKKETGVGFVRYVNQLRVWRAQQLLRDMRYRAGEVAGMVGFDNPQYFTRIFKEMTGIVPSEYRSRICPHDDET